MAVTAGLLIAMWASTVRVSGDLGEAQADFAIEVQEPNPISALFTWVTVIVFLALAGLGLLPYLRQRGRRRRECIKGREEAAGRRVRGRPQTGP